MRGRKQDQVSVARFLNVETMIPRDHPIQAIKSMLGGVLRQMDGHFEEIYAADGRPSIPPERLLLAKVLMAGQCRLKTPLSADYFSPSKKIGRVQGGSLAPSRSRG